jgi:hypothetical protein
LKLISNIFGNSFFKYFPNYQLIITPSKMDKRKRPFKIRIENFLPSKRPLQKGSGGSKKLGDYVDKLDGASKINKTFKSLQWDSKFMIKALPKNPEALLYELFQFCVDSAINDSNESGVKSDHLGCIISSPLLSSDIWIPIRPIVDDTVDLILNMFLKVAQSKAQEGIRLWGIFD